ncbi:MAG TPA: GAF domain-containing sensor histidine kinase [Patescibacteria group bacterium]|nr:GAF domain-containing sensor histidine kinase [Patescibacteria group bacterium]
MAYSTTPQTKKTVEALWHLEKIILDTLDFDKVVQKIVDSTVLELGYLQLGYEIVVLNLVNTEKQQLMRVSVSQTDRAAQALERLNSIGTPFHEIIIPLSEKDNTLVKCLESGEQFVVSDWYDILRPTFNQETARKIQQELGIKNSLIFPVRYGNATLGTIIFSMSKDVSLVSDDEMDLLRGFTDVVGLAVQNATIYTRLDETKEQLENANNQLKALDQMKDEFLSMASHELKSPMNAIKNYLWMAMNKANDHPEKLHDYLNTAYQSTQRLVALVNDLLDVSRIESGRVTLEIKPISLKTVISETVDIFAPQAKEKGLDLTVELPQDFTVAADDTKLREILSNLISNAIKYTLKGMVHVGAKENGNMIRISIQDSGTGISPQDQQKLFQKFSRVNASFKELASIEGTGLGLWICKQFVEKMGGSIGLDSTVGSGSTFWIELPKA